MKSILLASFLAMGVLCSIAADDAAAQYTPPPRRTVNPAPRPTVSPYLNLLRRGNTSAFNYVTLVRPELQLRESLRQVQQQADINRQLITESGDPALRATGHATSFLNYGGYFLGQGGQGSGSRQTAVTRARSGPGIAQRAPGMPGTRSR